MIFGAGSMEAAAKLSLCNIISINRTLPGLLDSLSYHVQRLCPSLISVPNEDDVLALEALQVAVFVVEHLSSHVIR